MVAWPARLRSRFQLLQVADRDAEALSSYPIDGRSMPSGDVRLAVDATGHRHVLIPVPRGTPIAGDTKSAGVQCGAQDLVEDGGGLRRYVDVVCRKPYLHDIFVRIAAQILERLEDEDVAPDVCAIEVIDRWRSLLAPGPRRGPSETEIVGMFGELLHLEELLAIDPDATRVWTGPSGAIHDFRGRRTALEVKAHQSHRGWRTSIHGVYQLDSDGLDELLLSVLHIEATPTGGHTIPELIDRAAEKGADVVELYDKLSAAGFGPEALESVADRRFRLVDRRMWRVEPGFPRIVRSSFRADALPDGVVDVRYEIDLADRASDAVSAAEAEALYRRLLDQ